ncbi:hypothetical protein AGMMS49975_17750 [Clostridia bacterium]|nr:hypothetical protein AGMMS49975_17750 [Clostridia bacterium]
MFDNQRYITRGVAAEIPPEQIALMWAIIDVRLLANPKLDYLQVFQLDYANELPHVQIITHTQEKPRYKNEIRASVAKTVCARVYVIDDGTYSTMMLSSDY